MTDRENLPVDHRGSRADHDDLLAIAAALRAGTYQQPVADPYAAADVKEYLDANVQDPED